MKDEKQKAAIYTRVSTPGQATRDAASLEAQADWAKGACQDDGCELFHHYEDAGKSATKDDLDNRPAMRSLLEDAAAGKLSRLYVYHEDRLARNTEVAGYIAANLRRAGVTVHTQRGLVDLDRFGGKVLYYINALLAEEEAHRIQDRCNTGKRHYAEGGDFTIWTEPHGYRWIPGDLRRGVSARLEEVPEQLEMVRFCYDLRANRGWTVRQITREVNARGYTTRTGGRWYTSSIGRILTNPRYKGEWRAWRDPETGQEFLARPELVPPPAIDPKLWEKAQRVAKHHKKHTRRRMVHRFLLNGFLHCRECGSPMIGHAIGKDGEDRTRYYQCNARKQNEGHACRSRYVPAEALEEPARALLEELADNPEAAAMYARTHAETDRPTREKEKARHAKLIAEAEARLDRLIAMRAAEEITAAELTRHRTKEELAIRESTERLEALRRHDNADAAAAEAVAGVAEAVAAGEVREALTNGDLQALRWFLKQTDFRMVLSCEDWNAKARERRYHLEIEWAAVNAGLVEAGEAQSIVPSPNVRAMNTAIWSRVTGRSGW